MPSKRRVYNFLTLGLYNKLMRLKESEADQAAAVYELSEFYRKMLEGLKDEELKKGRVDTGWTKDAGQL